MSEIKILYFAAIRECIGTPEEQISLPAEVKTISQLIDWLYSRFESFAATFEKQQIRVAIDCTHVKLDAEIGNAVEIAIFPPMSGG